MTVVVSARPSDVETQNKAVIAKAIEDYNAGKSGVLELMEPDLIWTIEGTGIAAGTYQGKGAFLEGASIPITSRMQSRMVMTLHGLYADGDKVILNFEVNAVALDGKPFHSAYVWIITMQNGRIVSGKAFLDLRAYDRVITEVQPQGSSPSAG